MVSFPYQIYYTGSHLDRHCSTVSCYRPLLAYLPSVNFCVKFFIMMIKYTSRVWQKQHINSTQSTLSCKLAHQSDILLLGPNAASGAKCTRFYHRILNIPKARQILIRFFPFKFPLFKISNPTPKCRVCLGKLTKPLKI